MKAGSTRAELMRRMQQGHIATAAYLCRCAAGIAVVAMIAVSAANAEKSDAQGQARRPGYEASVPAPVSAEAHRKQVFDERRERFAGARRAAGLAENTSRRGTVALP